VNRDAKTQSSLVALARTRRTQRALAHAYLHRSAPLSGLGGSLDYMTSTACVTDEAERHTLAHCMTVIGSSRGEGVAYVVEGELSGGAEPHDATLPIVYRLWLRGPRQGYLVPVHAWYEQPVDAPELRARIAAIANTLEPPLATTTEAWMLSTRIVQRRAVRIADTLIRKFALQLLVEPVASHGPSGKTTVTAFLRPQAQLADVWMMPHGAAIARITYCGIPSGVGLSKDTVVLLTSGIDAELP
jgi:hypothetical protein